MYTCSYILLNSFICLTPETKNTSPSSDNYNVLVPKITVVSNVFWQISIDVAEIPTASIFSVPNRYEVV